MLSKLVVNEGSCRMIFLRFRPFIVSTEEQKRKIYGIKCSNYEKTRQQAGKDIAPSYAIIDSQSVKTVYKGEGRGFDGNKKIKGRLSRKWRKSKWFSNENKRCYTKFRKSKKI